MLYAQESHLPPSVRNSAALGAERFAFKKVPFLRKLWEAEREEIGGGGWEGTDGAGR